MAQLLVRKLSPALVKQLKLRAVQNGVSAEEEHRRILAEALEKGVGDTQPKAPEEKRSYTMFDHFRKLGEIAPDFEFGRKRKRSKRRPLEL